MRSIASLLVMRTAIVFGTALAVSVEQHFAAAQEIQIERIGRVAEKLEMVDRVHAIGVAGMGRMMRANVIATSGRAVEAAGDCDVLLLDKTGTITFGNRQASSLHTVATVTQQQLAAATLLASLGDETPEGKSIVVHVKRGYGIAPPPLEPGKFVIVPFSAQTRMSGVTF